jgi:hypothetical protein
MYTNQGVAGGVTVVPQGVMQSRQPISSRVAVPVDAPTVARWQAEAQRVVAGPEGALAARVAAFVPPAPLASRVVAAPGGAVPAAPGAVRPAPWSSAAARVVGAGQGDGGQANRGERQPSAEPRNGVPGGRGVIAPPTTAQPANVARPVSPPVAPQGQPQTVQPSSPWQRENAPQNQRESQRESREPRAERDDRNIERRIAPPAAVQRAPAAVEPQRPVGVSPNVVAPQRPQPQAPQAPQVRPAPQMPQVQQPQPPQMQQPARVVNPGQAREQARERAQDRDDERRGQGPRQMREQQVR